MARIARENPGYFETDPLEDNPYDLDEWDLYVGDED